LAYAERKICAGRPLNIANNLIYFRRFLPQRTTIIFIRKIFFSQVTRDHLAKCSFSLYNAKANIVGYIGPRSKYAALEIKQNKHTTVDVHFAFSNAPQLFLQMNHHERAATSNAITRSREFIRIDIPLAGQDNLEWLESQKRRRHCHRNSINVTLSEI